MVFCCSGLAVINGRPDETCHSTSPAKKAPLISHALRPWNDFTVQVTKNIKTSHTVSTYLHLTCPVGVYCEI